MPDGNSSQSDRQRSGRAASLATVVALAAYMLPATVVVLGLARGNEWIAGPVADGGWTARTRAWFETRGLFPGELDESRSFSWTRTEGAFVVPLLDRRRAHNVRLEVRGVPPAPDRAAQELTLLVDGLVVDRTVLSGERQTLIVPIPPARGPGATVSFRLSHGFVPGTQDRRELGMIVDGIAIASADGPLRVPRRALMAAALAGALLGAAVGILGSSLTLMLVLAFAAAAGQAWLLSLDAAFLGNDYVWRLARFNGGVLLAAAIIWLALRVRPATFDGALRSGVCLVLVVLALRGAVFLHPSVTVGDAIFQVHRAELVHSGNYFFTSITPRPFFEFPYAPGLYVAAMPFWSSFPSKPDHVLLLRSIVLAADALTALALFAAVRRFWGARPAIVAAGMYQLIPVGLHTICTANLTNAFAQAVFGIALLLACAYLGRGRFAVWAGGVALLLTGAFLSHFSTLSTGVPIVLAVVLALFWRREDRRASAWLALALVLALSVSYAIYYSHFNEVYATTVSRILAKEGEAPTRSMVAPVSVKIERFVRAVRYEYFGLPLLGGVLAGVVALASRRAGDPWTRALAGWLAAGAGFLVLGIISPIEMRAALSIQPVIVALAGLGIAVLWDRNQIGRIGAAALVAAIVWRGLADWLLCLGRITVE